MHELGSLNMAGDKTKTVQQDADRVNVSENHEVQNWSKKFGSTPDKGKLQ